MWATADRREVDHIKFITVEMCTNKHATLIHC